jgi:hypothetical protein
VHQPKGNWTARSVIELDTIQRVVYSEYYNENEKIKERNRYQYQNNNLIESTEGRYYYNDEGNSVSQYYNKNKYTVDSTGLLRHVDKLNASESDTTYKHNNRWNYHYTPQKKVAYVNYHKTPGRMVYKYDEAGNKLQEKNYEGEKQTKSIYTYSYKYDAKNRITETKKDFGVNGIDLSEYYYDATDTLRASSKKSGVDFSLYNYTSTYTYDRFGNVQKATVAVKKPDEKTIININQYEYDANNNWTKRTAHFGPNSVEIVTRKITYYE